MKSISVDTLTVKDHKITKWLKSVKDEPLRLRLQPQAPQTGKPLRYGDIIIIQASPCGLLVFKLKTLK